MSLLYKNQESKKLQDFRLRHLFSRCISSVNLKQVLLPMLLLLLTKQVSWAQEVRTLALAEAKELAMKQNRLLGITREKINENEQKVTEARSRQFPLLYATGGYVYNGVTQDVVLPQGALAYNPTNGIVVPQADFPLLLSRHNLVSGNVLALQPISQLGKIRTGVKVAKSDVEIAKTQVSKAEQDVRQGVEKLYFGILIAQKQQEEAQLNLKLTDARLYDVESALLAGKTDITNKVGLQADRANQEQKLLQIQNQLEDYTFDLNEALGLPAITRLQLANLPTEATNLQPLENYTQQARTQNIDVRLASQNIQKAEYGVAAARRDYIPNISAVGGYTHQSVLTILPQDNYFVGLQGNWNIIDFGRRRSVLNLRRSLQQQAEENLQYTREQAVGRVEKAYRKVNQAQALVTVAQKAVQYRNDELKLKKDRRVAGLNLPRDVMETQAALAKAEADLFSAQLNYRLALSELEAAAGVLE
ncbi:MAG: hypothetical protein COW65_06465 [Cytophagales bacterium CG18_big_fil_WC_8_21_14_2_50_42_9]|nr:MAG: hypothetical protein COW65_06465 [Cytophagales bacterium CG18_big_fil_WC_8_21_14_2_50_42_9]